MFLSAIAWSTWLVVQSKLLELYPARLRLSTLQCLIGSVQSTIIAAALERERNSWKIRWDIQLASLAYCVSLSFPHTTYCHYHLTIINIYILLCSSYSIYNLLERIAGCIRNWGCIWTPNLVYREERAVLRFHVFSTCVGFNGHLLSNFMG
jgi:hypothetical protein